MAEQEYIIVVKDPTVWETSLWDELTKDGLGDDFIPSRSVTVVNDRPKATRIAHFSLTAEEAVEIAKDDRILSIELNHELNDEIEFGFSGQRATRTFNNERFSTTADMTNWGLARCLQADNPFGLPNNSSVVTLDRTFPFNLDGTGVDLIVVDSGVEEDHPELAVNADGTGGSRVVDFDWNTLGVTGCPTSASIGGYLGDADGHGTNCASIAAGNTQGWAPGATIYSLRIFSGSDITNGSSLGVISTNIIWDLIKAFHDKKIADGNKRPTICTNSWGFRTSYTNITSISYRGTTTSATSRDTSKGMVNSQHGIMIVSQNVAVQNAQSTGVIMVGAAGNYFHKSDVPSGLDYNNFYTSATIGNQFYHRGSSPTNAEEMICVGASRVGTNDEKINFSESGPRVDLYAPGQAIMGAYANKSYETAAVQDPRNVNYFLNKVSGTSQATPQVAGVMCLMAQLDPTITKTQMLEQLYKYSLVDVMEEGTNGSTDYGNTRGLQGGPNRLLQNPYVNPNRGGISST